MHTPACTHSRTHMHKGTRAFTRASPLYVHAYVYTCTHPCSWAHIHACVHMPMHTCTHIHTHVHTHRHVCHSLSFSGSCFPSRSLPASQLQQGPSLLPSVSPNTKPSLASWPLPPHSDTALELAPLGHGRGHPRSDPQTVPSSGWALRSL